MKKIIICITAFLFFCFIADAQDNFIYNGFQFLQPFSLSQPYNEKIQPNNMCPHYETASYNNDSLFWVYNDPDSIMIKPVIKAGFAIDSARYSFKQMATRFDLGHGYLWLLKITSPTSEGIAVYFEKFDLPEGASFGSYRIKQTGAFTSEPRMYNKENFDGFRFSSFVDGKELYVELYEPKTIANNNFDINIERISYFFSDGRRIAVPEAPKKKMKLK